MFPDQMDIISRWDRPPTYFRVLFHLLSVLDPTQYRVTSAQIVARSCDISVNSAERVLTMLTADRVIISRGSKVQRERRLNNRMVWASTAKNHNETLHDPDIEDARGR